MTKKILTQNYLKEILSYNPETGVFIRLIATSNSVKIGEAAGGMSGRGYLYICIFGKKEKAHRLAWLYMYGELPVIHIDHRDGNKLNNRIDNLRLATVSVNSMNCKKRSDNTSGYTGVYFSKQKDKYQAELIAFKNRVHLGFFVEIWDALCARKSGDVKYGFSVRHGSV